jgi:hypothetical protein
MSGFCMHKYGKNSISQTAKDTRKIFMIAVAERKKKVSGGLRMEAEKGFSESQSWRGVATFRGLTEAMATSEYANARESGQDCAEFCESLASLKIQLH